MFCRFDLSALAPLGLREVGMLGLEREGILGGRCVGFWVWVALRGLSSYVFANFFVSI